MQTCARALLFVQGAMCVVYGIVVAIKPQAMANYMGLEIISADGQAELITMYLAMSSAVGLFMLFAALTKKGLEPALLFMLIYMTGITLGRLICFISLETGSYILSSLLYDVPAWLLTVLAYWRLYGASVSKKA